MTDGDLAHLSEDATDRLHVLAHAWAASTATRLVVSADGLDPIEVAVAQPGALVAMKLQSVMRRVRQWAGDAGARS